VAGRPIYSMAVAFKKKLGTTTPPYVATLGGLSSTTNYC
jgi:hypothetical protein